MNQASSPTNHQPLAADELFEIACGAEETGDLAEAFRLHLQAAKQGVSGAQVNVGNAYSSGSGTQKNLRAAERWYREAFRQGERCGAINLGVDRRNQGRLRSAEFWFKKAIEQNDGEACLLLAKLKLRAGKRTQAVELIRQAASMTSRTDISEYSSEVAHRALRLLIDSKHPEKPRTR